MNMGVHRTHCCKWHGCKYGDGNECPVENGKVQQEHDCESCVENNLVIVTATTGEYTRIEAVLEGGWDIMARAEKFIAEKRETAGYQGLNWQIHQHCDRLFGTAAAARVPQ